MILPHDHDRVRQRLQELCLFPAQAASDELDHALDICRHFSGAVNLWPCCQWHPEATAIEVVSQRQFILGHHLEHRALVQSSMHWFAVHVMRESGLVWMHAYGFPPSCAEHFPKFLMHLADLFQAPLHQIRAQSFSYTRPYDMCGFQMLDASLQADALRALDQVQWTTLSDSMLCVTTMFQALSILDNLL